jgi:Permease for cytosine/purines, uracil, thiamine, allantoin
MVSDRYFPVRVIFRDAYLSYVTVPVKIRSGGRFLLLLQTLLVCEMVKSVILNYVKPSAWVLEPEPSTYAPSSNWSNRDMDPVPPKLRTWSTFNYIAYWLSDAVNVPVYELASSMLALGLSW